MDIAERCFLVVAATSLLALIGGVIWLELMRANQTSLRYLSTCCKHDPVAAASLLVARTSNAGTFSREIPQE